MPLPLKDMYDPGPVSSYFPMTMPGRANDLAFQYREAAPPGTELLAGMAAGLPAALGGYLMDTSRTPGRPGVMTLHTIETEPGDSPYSWLAELARRAKAMGAHTITGVPLANNAQGGRSMQQIVEVLGGVPRPGDKFRYDVPVENIERALTKEGRKEFLARMRVIAPRPPREEQRKPPDEWTQVFRRTRWSAPEMPREVREEYKGANETRRNLLRRIFGPPPEEGE